MGDVPHISVRPVIPQKEQKPKNELNNKNTKIKQLLGCYGIRGIDDFPEAQALYKAIDHVYDGTPDAWRNRSGMEAARDGQRGHSITEFKMIKYLKKEYTNNLKRELRFDEINEETMNKMCIDIHDMFVLMNTNEDERIEWEEFMFAMLPKQQLDAVQQYKDIQKIHVVDLSALPEVARHGQN